MVESNKITENALQLQVSLKVDDNWIATTSTSKEIWKKALAKVGVSRLRVGNSSAIGFSYYVEATTNKQVTLIFTDSEGDVYSLRCVENGDHVVRYNAEKPTITEIRVEVLDKDIKKAIESSKDFISFVADPLGINKAIFGKWRGKSKEAHWLLVGYIVRF